MAGNILRNRIARKILLGYVVPLAVLLVAGLLLPILFWSYLGKASAEYEASLRAADRVNAIARAAQNSKTALRDYVLYRDDNFRQQFQDSHDAFRDNSRDLSLFLDNHPNAALTADLEAATIAYRQWRLRQAIPLIRVIEANPGQKPTDNPVLKSQNFQRVADTVNTLKNRMQSVREDLNRKAKANNTLRLIIAISVPTAAILLALLIVRSNTIGITRPLEALTEATEILEQGEIARVLVGENEEAADDEIGDLQKAFRRMARTIGQREAILRAQNETVGALKRRVEAVLNATNDAIIMLDRGGGFSVVNARFAQLFGIEPEVLLDHTFSQAGPLLLSRFQDKETVRQCFHSVLDDPEAICDETMEIREPVHRVLRFYSAPVRGGDDAKDLLGRIFVFRDVTHESAVDRMKTEFVSTVSHELRTPLTAIKGYIDLIVSGQTGEVSEIQMEFLNLVQASTRRLSSLINDMLDVSRIESGRIILRQESVDYTPLVEQTVRMMQNEAAQKQIALAVKIFGPAMPNEETDTDQEPLPVVGDSDRITQVLVNLISNAVKYTPNGGSVTITVEYEGDFVTTCVSDTGIGINREDQARLFQKFFRADNSTTREVGGTGLGLAITKAVLEKLHGSIWVESAPQQGSRFYFTLPTIKANLASVSVPYEEAEPDIHSMVAVPPSAPRKLVLCIDGDVSALRRLSVPLREGSFATSNAATPSEALRRARALRPDLITLGLFSQKLQSLVLLRDLQTDPITRQIPIVLLSLQIQGGEEAEITSGIALLPKPLNPALLTKIAGPIVDIDGSPFSTILTIGEAVSTEVLHHCFTVPLLNINHVDTLAEAMPTLTDPALSLIILDLDNESVSDEDGVDRETVLTRFYVEAARNRVPLLLLTDALTSERPIVPLLPFGSPPVLVSGLTNYLKAFISHEMQEIVETVAV